MTSLTPLRNRCIVRRDPAPETSAGGIFLLPNDPMDTQEVRLHTGVITAIGREVRGVKLGERVTFTNWEDMHLNDPRDGELMVIQEADILGVLEEC